MRFQTLWRLTKRSYADSAFSGEGARLYGGRFNPPGTPVVYTAESLALAVVEMLTTLPSYQHLQAYVYIRVDLPERQREVSELTPADLPDGWDQRPPGAPSQRKGQEWIEAKEMLACAVPSVVIPHSWNVLLNPAHPAMDELEIDEPEAFPVDERLRSS